MNRALSWAFAGFFQEAFAIVLTIQSHKHACQRHSSSFILRVLVVAEWHS